tara:strand:+ start:604 stop:1386 length:783 start_codon:yes stop_codon:yes gene_type:complete
MKELKIRASALGKIMSDDPKTKISTKQLLTLEGLLSKIKVTDKQAELRDVLLLKRDAEPELSKGAKTYIRELWLEENFGIRQEINSCYIDKGNQVEDLSIELAETMLELGRMYKNDEYFENDYIKGTPDVVTDTHIIDVKSSWSAATFPFFDEVLSNKNYEWQLKAYMWMSNIHKAFLSYCLVPTPELLIQDEMRKVSWNRGEAGDVSQEVEDEVRAFHNLEAIPIINRIKSFEVNLNSDDIVKMKDKVSLAREYYNTLK